MGIMADSQHAWSQKWADRLERKVQELGYANLTDLLADLPARPYSELAQRLGDVAPIQIISVQFREARLTGRERDAAKDSLVRNLVEQLPNGWGIGEEAEWQAVRALSSWSSEIQVTGECEELKAKLLAVAHALRELPPPRGPDDPIIADVFESHWC
jgi:hypothetical protein